MKKLCLFVCTVLLGAGLSLAEVTSTPAPGGEQVTVAAKGRRHHHHHHHHRAGRRANAAGQPPR